MPTRIFTVNAASWTEHRRVGVAAINDPAYKAPTNAYNLATRDKVLAEISGIRPGDRLYFYMQQDKTIYGGYSATTSAFFNASPLFRGASVVDASLPFRVGFKEVQSYPAKVKMSDIWASRDKGDIWTIQQARGDVAGRHACTPLTRREADIIDQMFLELNSSSPPPEPTPPPPKKRPPLPYRFDLAGGRFPHLAYEAALLAALLEGLAEGRWHGLLGDYDDFMPYVPTSEGTEMDLVLTRHQPDGRPLWFLLIELKKDRFQWEHLKQLLSYETWMTAAQAGGNPRAVHMAACASRFDDDVLQHIRQRETLGQKPVILLRYSYESAVGGVKGIDLARVDLTDQ